MKVLNPGSQANPLLEVTSDEVLTWLRQKADEMGFADRELSAVQISVTQPFAEGKNYHYEAPTLIVMVSNIPDSRSPRL